MNRRTNYAGATPLETDVLWAQRYAMTALAYLAQNVLGTSTVVFGAAVTPTSPASMAVLVNQGQIYQLAPLEPTAWSSLPSDSTSILKQGLLGSAGTTLNTPAPITSGQSINYLIEAQYQEIDGDLAALSYYNVSNSQAPFSGANNNGATQPTTRKGTLVVQAKPGTAASTGTQTTPSVDSGWVPLAVVTANNGASNIDTGHIAIAAGAPYSQSFATQSGSFTLTATGFSSTAPAGTCYYRAVGPIVTLMLPGSLLGTSNLDTFTVTGLPSIIQPASGLPTQNLALPPVTDNGASNNSGYAAVGGAGNILFGANGSLTAWTATGSKGVPGCVLTYLRY